VVGTLEGVVYVYVIERPLDEVVVDRVPTVPPVAVTVNAVTPPVQHVIAPNASAGVIAHVVELAIRRLPVVMPVGVVQAIVVALVGVPCSTVTVRVPELYAVVPHVLPEPVVIAIV
jgi:hypothetical protein